MNNGWEVGEDNSEGFVGPRVICSEGETRAYLLLGVETGWMDGWMAGWMNGQMDGI